MLLIVIGRVVRLHEDLVRLLLGIPVEWGHDLLRHYVLRNHHGERRLLPAALMEWLRRTTARRRRLSMVLGTRRRRCRVRTVRQVLHLRLGIRRVHADLRGKGKSVNNKIISTNTKLLVLPSDTPEAQSVAADAPGRCTGAL